MRPSVTSRIVIRELLPRAVGVSRQRRLCLADGDARLQPRKGAGEEAGGGVGVPNGMALYPAGALDVDIRVGRRARVAEPFRHDPDEDVGVVVNHRACGRAHPVRRRGVVSSIVAHHHYFGNAGARVFSAEDAPELRRDSEMEK